MKEYYHITLKSGNKKTGKIAVTTSSSSTCPKSCPFKGNGCYAEGGPLRIHWDKVNSGERGITFSELIKSIKSIQR